MVALSPDDTNSTDVQLYLPLNLFFRRCYHPIAVLGVFAKQKLAEEPSELN